MKLRQSFTSFLIVLLTVFGVFTQAKEFSINESPLPAPTGMVNDFAEIIDDSVQAQIEQKLRDFKAKTNPPIEIAVVTVRTTGNRPIFDYSLATARGWKLGDKGSTNSSALLMVAVDDKKYFTQVSGGLQDELTDGIIGQLNRQYLVPAFKAGDYSKGINDTIDAYLRTIQERNSAPVGAPTPTPTPTNSYWRSWGIFFCCIVVIMVIVVIILSSIGKGGSGGGGSGSSRDRWRSGGFGGSSGSRDSSYSPVIIWGGGSSDSTGGSSDWGNSGGDSWGGFGGGGGGFDGGGAGGDW